MRVPPGREAISKGDFLWCDLSTFHVAETKSFYARLFGWDYGTITQPDGTPYFVGSTSYGESAGIFEMPRKFRDVGLPSFWMSYIGVDNIDQTLDRARRSGGKVELGPLALGDGASIALIRDPLGAGFTVYQGRSLPPRRAERSQGHMAWNALYVSNACAVMDFYRAIFDWKISEDVAVPNLFRISNATGIEISAIHEVPTAVRGGYEFWGVHFAVPDLLAAKRRVLSLGGQILYEDTASEDPSILAQDPDGAASFLVDCKSAGYKKQKVKASRDNHDGILS